MKLYIEDLICRLGNSGSYMFDPALTVWPLDVTVISSLAMNPSMGKGYTEKQRTLVLRLCKKYKGQLISALGPAVESALENPEFKFSLVQPGPQEKSITIDNKNILVKFPFNEEIVGKIRKFKSESAVRLVEWDGDAKAWTFALEENNVIWIMNNLMNSGFNVDPNFLKISEEITEILANIEDHVPIIVHEDNQFAFKNVHRTVPQPTGMNLKETLLLAKYYGISVWEENVEKMIETGNFSPILTSFLKETTPNSLEFDINENSIDQLTDLIKYNSPVLIIVPGYNEFFTLKNWCQWLKSQEISEKDISVMFRLSSDTGSMFNDLVKQEGLNNPIGENTKIVFISQKMPKPLIKSDIEFKLVLNLGSLSGVHYSISTYLDSRPDVIRYTDKNKSGYQFGLL